MVFVTEGANSSRFSDGLLASDLALREANVTQRRLVESPGTLVSLRQVITVSFRSNRGSEATTEEEVAQKVEVDH